ncbi:MAG: sensor histidine kinase [Caulobacterales bacterium]
MASRPRGPSVFALGVGLRALSVGLLAFAAAYALSHQLYATALVALAVAVIVTLDIVRAATAADRALARFVDGVTAAGDERPTELGGFPALAASVAAALDRLVLARSRGQERIDLLEAVADNVMAALLVVDEAGEVASANRAALRRLGEVGGRLDRLPALGARTAAALLQMSPGARRIIELGDGESMLASVAAFATPRGGRHRLIALQSLSGDLDAVEQKAWHDLTRILAHEMMNSLTPICSLAESIRLQLDGAGAAPELAEAVEVIARRSAGLMSFVERYRAIAEMPPVSPQTIAAAPFIEAMDRLMQPLAAAAGVAYESRAQAGLAFVADRDLLEQATINLLKNALDAVRGGERPRVSLTCGESANGVVITVADNGPGLDPADIDLVFVPFYSTKAGGSGIGLSIARQVALGHGGRLTAARGASGGAEFRMVLPARGIGPAA